MTMTVWPEADQAPPPEPELPLQAKTAWWIREGRPRWALPAMATLGLLAAVCYTWDLSRNGMGNTFYAAAVKSGTESWKAFLFGSLDPGSFITVDKPPAALWVMELSGRLFGFSSWSMLLPEAVAGVVTVLVVYHLVQRWQGEVAGLLAGTAMVLTPVAAVMFRYNNPDAVLTLFLVLAAWALWSALETAKTWKLVACGVLLGLAFTTKELQAFIVLPAMGLVYLLFGPPKLVRRIVQLLWAGVALLVSAGWWVALVAIWPAASRPYVGGSTNNSELNLIFGYNGLSRIFGSSGGGGGAPTGGSSAALGRAFGGGAGGGPNFGGSPGITRLFNSEVGGELSWLIPLALIGLVGGLWLTARNRRTDLGRAGFVLWGGWVLTTMVVFSYAKGIFHPYYTVALAPGLAALAAGGAVALWRLGQRNRWLSWVLPAAVIVSAVWAVKLLDRNAGYDTWLTTFIIVCAVVAVVALGLVLSGLVRARWLAVGAAIVAAVTVLAGPAAYTITSIGNSYSGATPTAGPTTSGGMGGFGGAGGGGFGRALGLGQSGGGSASTTETAVDKFLVAHRGSAEYIVAVSGSQSAAPIILATGKPVIAMGGFTGTDPAPTLAQFKKLVAEGKVHYVMTGGGFAGFGGGASFGGGAGGQPGVAGAAGGQGLPGGALPNGPTSAGLPKGFTLPNGVKLPKGFTLPPRSGQGFGRGGFGGGFSGGQGRGGTVSAVEQWVESHGTKVTVPGSGGTTLYYVSSADASK